MSARNHQPGVIYPPYVVYTVDSITSNKVDGSLVAIEFRGLTGFIRWRPGYFRLWDHFEFYATSDGWNLLTGTGYRSFMLHHESDTNETVICDWFTEICNDCFPEDHQHQQSLF